MLTEPAKFPSREEEYTWWYIKELYAAGFIVNAIHQPESFVLCEEKKLYGMVSYGRYRSSEVPHAFPWVREHKYTADYYIEWQPDALGIFVKRYDDNYDKSDGFFFAREYKGKIVSWIDAKGAFLGQHNNSGVTFPMNQKWVLDKYDIYVQKVVPVRRTSMAINKGGLVTLNGNNAHKIKVSGIFPETFTPARYLTCDKLNVERNVKFPTISLKEFVKRKEERIETVESKTKNVKLSKLF